MVKMQNMWIHDEGYKKYKEKEEKMPEVISLDLYFTDFVTKADRRVQFASVFTPEILANAQKLLIQVNALLNDLNVKTGDVTSGWRPAIINASTPNAAKSSYHMLGLAVDILDNKNQDLAKLIAAKPDLLRKYNLWLESPTSTKGINTNWVHLDVGVRSDRPSRIFLP
jgi:hypothetical protein